VDIDMSEDTKRSLDSGCSARWVVLVVLVTLGAGAGLWWWDQSGDGADGATPTSAGVQMVEHPWDPPEPVDLTDPDAHPTRELALGEPQRFPDCHRLFEPDGVPLEHFPLADDEKRPMALASCDPEGYRVLEDGRRVVAYATPADEDGWDLRVTFFGADGELLWHHRLDRSANAANFKANFRGSFIAPILPRLICAGTLWDGGTQAACIDADTGESKWSGTMRFWSGIAPQGLEHGLNAASSSGLTRRYPYSGVEMRFMPFEATGGRAAYYATDGQRLFFAPADDEADNALTAFDMAEHERLWKLELPARPLAGWAHAFVEPGVVLFEIDDTIYAADTDTGELLWAAIVGADRPSVVAIDEALYVLLRRESEPNLLYELDARTGQIGWQAPVPTGTLELRDYEHILTLRSVRAVQRVAGLD
jgi:hypothetical protein